MGAPLFILSFRHRDELDQLVQRAGWQPIAARRAAGAEGRFLASGAAVAVVDARGALEEGLAAVRALSDPVEANGGALLALLSRTDAAALPRVFEHGATHFLVSPFSEAQFLQAVQFALRHAERVGGTPYLDRRSDPQQGSSWRWTPGSSAVELSPSLARKAGLGDAGERRIALMDLFRKLDPDGRRAARAAVQRAVATGASTAFAHDDLDGRMAHHLRVEGGGAVVGRAEMLPEQGVATVQRDALTGLREGRAARQWIANHLRESVSDAGLVAILVSVSRYDAINAAFGRVAGDNVLQAVARRIERVVEGGRNRMLARMAGAEFAVLLAPPDSLAEGRLIARQIVEAVARPFASGDRVITLASRAGVATSHPGDDAAALLRRASSALAEAKAAESAPIHVLDDARGSDGVVAQQLEVDLRRALAEDEIAILFQPQVSVVTGRIVGVEALARWRHPELGELGAATLFEVAERSDYLPQVSEHVQRKAVRAAAAWPAPLQHLRLAVNVTSADMAQPGFAEHFISLVRDSGFPADRLTVEVTEGGLIDDLAGAANLLAALRGGGLRVAIDDFGTGYSSLAYLKALPLDYLKIDKRLSEDIAGSHRDRVVVRGVIDMARSLGLTVIAEGVETEQQLGLLAQEGCNLYQGFLCAPPVEADALSNLLAGSPA